MELKYKSWNTLPVGKYMEIRNIVLGDEDNKDIRILSVLCDCGIDDILNAPIGEVVRLKTDASFLNNKFKTTKKYDKIVIGGKKYNITTDFRKVTTAQFIDFETFYKDFDNNYPQVLATFIIPEGHKYNDGYDALETAELFKSELDIETAENACFFFARNSQRSLKAELMHLMWETMKVTIKTRKTPIGKKMLEIMGMIKQQIELITGSDKLMRSLTQN